jgi:hypothetical protein
MFSFVNITIHKYFYLSTVSVNNFLFILAFIYQYFILISSYVNIVYHQDLIFQHFCLLIYLIINAFIC